MALFEKMFFGGRKKSGEKQESMYLRSLGRGKSVSYELTSRPTQRVEWFSGERDAQGNPVAVREPSEVTREYSRRSPFSVAGKTYPNLRGFLIKGDGDWAEDIYGRTVLCVKELYPCFDSYDYLNENRYFRWFIIREGNSISRVFTSDDRDKIYVTEDVQNVEEDVWNRMRVLGFCQPPAKDT